MGLVKTRRLAAMQKHQRAKAADEGRFSHCPSAAVRFRKAGGEMNLIQEELELAKSQMFDLIPGTGLVELSKKNVAKVEAIIQNDSAYIKSSDKDACAQGGYKGSTAYWMTRLKPILLGAESVADEYYDDVLSNAIQAVDRDNSTHLNADGVGRDEMLDRIKKIPVSLLVEYLKCPRESKYHLINLLSQATHPNDSKHKPRTNLSFASKFCHYACFYLFEGELEQDNYSIYDNVVLRALPRYCDYYKVSKPSSFARDYLVYQTTIDEIIKAAGGLISRNGFDHLLWYYFKGRD